MLDSTPIGAPALALAACLALSAPALAGGGTLLELEPDRDNTLYEDPAGALSNGAGDHLFARVNGQGSVGRAVLRFDVAGRVPAGSSIIAAELELHVSQVAMNPPPLTMDVHRVLADWGEGSSDAPGSEGGGAPSTPGDATWIHTFFSSSTWITPGGDFDSSPLATQDVLGVGDYVFAGSALTSEVQSWLDSPGQNFGCLVKVRSELNAGDSRRFDSRENPDLSVRPVLRLRYQAPLGTPYCTASPNSVGAGAFLTAVGDPSVAANDVRLEATGLPSGQTGLFFFGDRQLSVPFGDGSRCVGGTTRRLFPPFTSANGTLARVVDLGAAPAAGVIVPGASVNFQLWYLDPMGPGGSGFNTSDARNVAFQ